METPHAADSIREGLSAWSSFSITMKVFFIDLYIRGTRKLYLIHWFYSLDISNWQKIYASRCNRPKWAQ